MIPIDIKRSGKSQQVWKLSTGLESLEGSGKSWKFRKVLKGLESLDRSGKSRQVWKVLTGLKSLERSWQLFTCLNMSKQKLNTFKMSRASNLTCRWSWFWLIPTFFSFVKASKPRLKLRIGLNNICFAFSYLRLERIRKTIFKLRSIYDLLCLRENVESYLLLILN